MPYCPNCGRKVRRGARSCPYCYRALPVRRTEVSMLKATKGFFILLAVVIGGLLAVGLLGGLMGGSLGPRTEPLVTKSVSELLPTKSDLPTEWVIGTRNDETVDANGFREGVKLALAKIEDIPSAAVIQVYKFDSSATATDYYDAVVSAVKDKRGYKEFNVGLGSKSYETLFESLESEIATLYCVEKNIYFKITVSNIALNPQDDALLLAEIVEGKI